MADFTFSGRSYDFLTYVDCKNWIDGAWVDAKSGKTIDVDNPRHGKTMGQVVWSDRADVDEAVAAAKAALPGWRTTPLKERVQVLFRMKQLMEENIDELSWLLSHENGKTIAQARGSVSLSQGTIDAGGAGSATLGRRERGGDNTFGVQYSGASGLQVQSDRVLLDGAAGSGGSAGRTEVSDLDARVAADGTVRGSAAQIDARDLRFGN